MWNPEHRLAAERHGLSGLGHAEFSRDCQELALPGCLASAS